MNPASKNKLLISLVVILLVANAITIAMFWMGRKKHPMPAKGTPKEFLSKELKLDSNQNAQLELLVNDHRRAAEQLREKTKAAKEVFFSLLKETDVSDSMRQTAAKEVSKISEELDLLTFKHFQKVRELCTPEQKKKFDEIIGEVVRMMGQPRPPGPGNDRKGPPPGEHGGDHPPGRPEGDRPPPPQG